MKNRHYANNSPKSQWLFAHPPGEGTRAVPLSAPSRKGREEPN